MYRRLVRNLHHADNDAGIGMIMVIGLSFVMILIVSVLMMVVSNSLAGSGRHLKFDSALSAAESGVDQTLSRLERDYVDFGADYATPGPGSSIDPSPSCTATITNPTLPFASANAERDYAKTTIATLAANHPECIQHSSTGDFVVIRPSNVQTVYAEGWSPSYGNDHAITRLIKTEYLFSPYAPSNAILTGCNLLLEHSTTVSVVSGADPTLAAVHSNCTISTPDNATQVSGPVSSSDPSSTTCSKCTDNPGGTIPTTPIESVPQISAAEIYHSKTAGYVLYPGTWYDLCPDGTVRTPTSDGPCPTPADSGTVLATLTSGTSQYRGFQYEGSASSKCGSLAGACWNVVNQAADGIYYAQAGNVYTGTGLGNPLSNSLTIIAAAADETVCPKVGGTIDWDHNDISAWAMTDTFMFADADLITGSNFYAGSDNNNTAIAGTFAAGDQINMTTSSQGAYGNVIAGDQCSGGGPVTENVVDNPKIIYDPKASTPFTNIINTTLWLEYTGVN